MSSLSETSDEEVNNEPLNKRRKRNTEEWKRNKIPAKKAKGEEHVGWKGQLVPKRTTGPDCGCKKKCLEKFSEEEKQAVLKKFNRFGSKLAQDVHLQSGIRTLPVKRRRKNAVTHKSASYYYFICKGKEEVSVCRKAYCSLHGEKEGRIKRLASLKSKDAVPTDGRGKHHNRPNAHSEEKLHLIHGHIKSFPFYQTHYSSTIKYYLSSELSVAKMHRLFLEKHFPCCFEQVKNGTDQDKVCCVPIHVYRNYYIEHFNLKFGRPKTDVCNLCEELKCKLKTKMTPQETRNTENRLKVHKSIANAFYGNLKKAQEAVKEDPTVECLVFDFMQHLPVPHLPVNEIFYLRQLWLYTFGVHHFYQGGDKAYFYMWAECDAGHGANEVISTINHVIQNKVGAQCTKLQLFSDACTGQNRNYAMVRYLMTLVNTSRFETVQHCFPTRGHSFLPCDRDFAKLGRLKKNKERVGVPGEWISYLGENNDITTFQSIQFFNYSKHFELFYKKNVKSKGESFAVTKYKRILYTKGKNSVQVSQTSGSNVWSVFNLLKGGFSFNEDGMTKPDMPSTRMYNGIFSVPIKSDKLNDIKKLYSYLTPNEIEYYNNIKEKALEPAPEQTDTVEDENQ